MKGQQIEPGESGAAGQHWYPVRWHEPKEPVFRQRACPPINGCRGRGTRAAQHGDEDADATRTRQAECHAQADRIALVERG
jgi:hypothetical protein